MDMMRQMMWMMLFWLNEHTHMGGKRGTNSIIVCPEHKAKATHQLQPLSMISSELIE